MVLAQSKPPLKKKNAFMLELLCLQGVSEIHGGP